MGYELHIRRPNKVEITIGEWLEMAVAEGLEARTGDFYTPAGVHIHIPVDALFAWRDPSGREALFDWRRGRISVKSPNDAAVAKMVEIARKLGAGVTGDGGESYGS